jgi:hypothetical protein
LVPSECPICGAPVDQVHASVASQSSSPECAFCHHPLPVRHFEPAVPVAARHYDQPRRQVIDDGYSDWAGSSTVSFDPDPVATADPRRMSYGQWQRVWRKTNRRHRLGALIVGVVIIAISIWRLVAMNNSLNAQYGNAPAGTKVTISGYLLPTFEKQSRGVVDIYHHGKLLTVVHTDSEGNFQVTLLVGKYELDGFIGTNACMPDDETIQNLSDGDIPIQLIC